MGRDLVLAGSRHFVIVQHERPFIFSGPLVLAIISGDKTVTRRPLRGPYVSTIDDLEGDVWDQALGRVAGEGRLGDRGRWLLCRRTGRELPGWTRNDPPVVFASVPYCLPGDTLWVRESWRVNKSADLVAPSGLPPNAMSVQYEAGPASVACEWGRIRQSIFLPRWATRVTRKVTRTVVERLQDITEEQALAEGVEPGGIAGRGVGFSARERFEALWDKVNAGKKGILWADNPLVVATTFEGP